MQIRRREKQVLDFIDTFKAASTSQLQKLFYSEIKDNAAKVYTQIRLKAMFDNGYIKRSRSDINSEYVYYYKKTPFLHHQVTLVNVYIKLQEMKDIEILEFQPEFIIDDIRPDAKVMVDDGEYMHLFFVEIHRREQAFDQQKYEDFYSSKAWKKHFEAFPKVLIVSDKKVTLKESKIPYVVVPNTLEGIEKIIGG